MDINQINNDNNVIEVNKLNVNEKEVKEFRQGYSYGNNDNNSRCYRCDSPSHLANSQRCPAKYATCKSCGKKGHLFCVCKSQFEENVYKFCTDEQQRFKNENAFSVLNIRNNNQITDLQQSLKTDNQTGNESSCNSCREKEKKLNTLGVALKTLTEEKNRMEACFIADNKSMRAQHETLVTELRCDLKSNDIIIEELRLKNENVESNLNTAINQNEILVLLNTKKKQEYSNKNKTIKEGLKVSVVN